MSQTPLEPSPATTRAAFLNGLGAAWRSIFAYVLVGNYIGIGALSYEFGFSLPWMILSTLVIWAAPAQVILISTLTTATLLEVAIAVGLSSARFLPMVAALVPLLKAAHTRQFQLLLPSHLTAISVWVEGMRMLPQVPRAERVPFYNGLGLGLLSAAVIGSVIGYALAARLPQHGFHARSHAGNRHAIVGMIAERRGRRAALRNRWRNQGTRGDVVHTRCGLALRIR